MNLLFEHFNDGSSCCNTSNAELSRILNIISYLDVKDLHYKNLYFGVLRAQDDYVIALFVQFKYLESRIMNVWTYTHYLCKFAKIK